MIANIMALLLVLAMLGGPIAAALPPRDPEWQAELDAMAREDIAQM